MTTAKAVEIASEIHWIGALDPRLREFDIILKTANGTTYNAYCVRGQTGVAIIDTVKASHAEEFFTRTARGRNRRRSWPRARQSIRSQWPVSDPGR